MYYSKKRNTCHLFGLLTLRNLSQPAADYTQKALVAVRIDGLVALGADYRRRVNRSAQLDIRCDKSLAAMRASYDDRSS